MGMKEHHQSEVTTQSLDVRVAAIEDLLIDLAMVTPLELDGYQVAASTNRLMKTLNATAEPEREKRDDDN